MMGNSLLECCVFGRRAGRRRRPRSERSGYIDTDLYGAVEDAAAHLYVWALKDIPQDLRDASPPRGRRRPRPPGAAS